MCWLCSCLRHADSLCLCLVWQPNACQSKPLTPLSLSLSLSVYRSALPYSIRSNRIYYPNKMLIIELQRILHWVSWTNRAF